MDTPDDGVEGPIDNDSTPTGSELPGMPAPEADPLVPPVDEMIKESNRKAALTIAAAVAALAIIIAIIFALTSGDDDGDLAADSTTSTTVEDTTTTVEETTTTVEETTTTTTTTTTVPETTTTVPQTTTTTTSTTTTTTTTTLPPATTTIPVVTVPPTPAPTLWDVVLNSPDLSEFKAAVETAGLVDAINGPDVITVFAPSNPAFAQLRAGVGGPELLNDPAALAAVLRNHIVTGQVLMSGLTAPTDLPTLGGGTLTVDAQAGTVDDAMLLVRDVQASNGALDVINRVLIAVA